MISRTLIVLLFFLNLNNTLAWDGCARKSWICGDTCIDGDYGEGAECKCGGEIFNHTAQMWCCNNKPCEGRGKKNRYNTWLGEKDKKGRRIGAECNGTALKLEKPCNGKCNDHQEDRFRNFLGLVRSYRACKVKNISTTQCIREDKYLDGDLECRNRADEEIFQTSIGDTSLVLLDLEQILRPCKDSRGGQGFNCSGSSKVDSGNSNCLRLYHWCQHNYIPRNCTELAGTTATGRSTDSTLCSNQTFWEHRSCNFDHKIYHRCTGDTPGQCVWERRGDKCLDGSSEIKEAEDGHCDGEEVMCTARDGRFAGKKICVEKKFQCDNHLQCQDGKDEDMCEEEYEKKRIFTRDQRVICRSPFLNITSEENKKGKFFTMRGIRCSQHHHDHHYHPLRFFVNTSCSGATRSPSVQTARTRRDV